MSEEEYAAAIGAAPLPEPDRDALVMADLAYLEEPSGTSDFDRLRAAIRAYLWAAQETRPRKVGNIVMIAGPTLEEYRAARAAEEPS